MSERLHGGLGASLHTPLVIWVSSQPLIKNHKADSGSSSKGSGTEVATKDLGPNQKDLSGCAEGASSCWGWDGDAPSSSEEGNEGERGSEAVTLLCTLFALIKLYFAEHIPFTLPPAKIWFVSSVAMLC